jgi:AraC-like DNA-binding protein
MFHQPVNPRLKNFIVCYWFIDVDGIPKHTKMLPDGYSDIMLNMGPPYAVLRPDGQTETINYSALFGQRSTYLLLDQPQQVRMVGIRLRPGTEYAFTGIHAFLLLNKVLSLKTFTGLQISRIEEELKQPELDHAEKIDVIEQMLLEMLDKNKSSTNEKTDKAIEMLLKQKGQVSIEELISQIGLSYKQLERHFKKHVGMSPKLYLRIQRFYHAFSMVRSGRETDWMSVLMEAGYYDQSHFIKDFKFFAGLPPSKQLSLKDTLDELFGFA